MKRNFLLKLLTSIFCLIIIFPKKILSDFEYLMPDLAEVKRRCKNYGLQNRVKLFSQCKPYSNSTYNETCCYITGKHANGTYYDGCTSTNTFLFANKTITYTSSGISGTLICTDDYNYNKYINISFFSLFLLMIFLMIF